MPWIWQASDPSIVCVNGAFETWILGVLTSHVLKEDLLVSEIEALQNKSTGPLLGQDLVGLDFFAKLLPGVLVLFGNFDNNIRVNLVDGRHAARRNQLHFLKFSFCLHNFCI